MSDEQQWPASGQEPPSVNQGGQSAANPHGAQGQQGRPDAQGNAPGPGGPVWPAASAPHGPSGHQPQQPHQTWPQGQGQGQGDPAYGGGHPYGGGQHYGGGQPYGPAQGYGSGPAYGPGHYGQYGYAPGAPSAPGYPGAVYPPGPPAPPPPSRPQGRTALKASAAALVLVAAVVAGGAAGRLIWPSSASANVASPPTTTPTTTPSSGLGGSGAYPFGGGSGTGSNGGSGAEGSGGPSDVSSIAAKVDSAVVDINVVFTYQGEEGAGTGIVLTSNGLVLTNNHVIDDATKISVTDVGNGKTYSATVVGYDNTHDVALIQLQGASGLTTAQIAGSAASMGESVVAIGNAGGAGGTPTSAGGSVTALNQSITASDELDSSYEQLAGLIEVNANIESGDSGGPLVNSAGQVVGMDTAASQGSFDFSASGNQGFAIPISQALSIVKQIESGKGNSVVHVGATAFLGVMVQATATPGLGGAGSSSSTDGAPICDESTCIVSGGPAQKAGLQPGDIITSVGGTKVTSSAQLTHALVPDHPGQTVKVTYLDPTGTQKTANVVLASGPPA